MTRCCWDLIYLTTGEGGGFRFMNRVELAFRDRYLVPKSGPAAHIHLFTATHNNDTHSPVDEVGGMTEPDGDSTYV